MGRLLNFPEEQVVQKGEAGEAENFPDAQSSQVVAKSEENFPEGQSEQKEVPELEENVPAEQPVHDAAAAAE